MWQPQLGLTRLNFGLRIRTNNVRNEVGQTGWPRRVADSSARTRKLFLGEIIHDSCHLVMTCSYSFADSNRVTAICDDLITC